MSPVPNLVPYKKKVYTFNAKTPLEVVGCINTSVSVENISKSADFLVVPEANTTILGYTTAIDLNILHIGPYNTHVHTVNNVSESIELKDLLHEYNDRFHGLGKLQVWP